MEFCPIGPLWSLEKYVAPAKYQMCLAPYCANAEYLAFYKRMVAEGKYVILDNGAYERKTLSNIEYADLINELSPSEYVVPDSIGDPKQTLIEWENWMRTEPNLIRRARGFVVHAMGAPVPYTADVLHFPKHLGRERIRIIRLHSSSTIHALGFIDEDPLAELPKLAALGVRSIDSSEPIWKGMYNKRVGEQIVPKFKDFVFQSESLFTKFTSIETNLGEVQQLCRPVTDVTGNILQPRKKYKITEYGMGLPLTVEKANRDITVPRYDLIPKEFLDDLARTFEEGLRYGEHNWKHGDDAFFTDVMNHASGHIANYNNGDRSKPHLAHAAWNLLARAWYDRRKENEDSPVQVWDSIHP